MADRDAVTTIARMSPAGPIAAFATFARTRARWMEGLGVALFTLWVAWPYCVPGKPVASLDGLAYTAPNLRITLDALRDGRLPLWNDTIFGGVPHAANPQTAVFSPTRWLVLWFDPTRAVNVLTVFHLAVLAIGMFALCAWRLRLRPPATFVACVITVGCGAMESKIVQFEQLSVIAWVPLLLALTHWIVTAERPWRPLGATAFATACWMTAGHPQVLYLTAPVLVVWTAAVAADVRRWTRIIHAAGTAALGALIALPHLLLTAGAADDAALSGGRDLAALARPGFSALARDFVGALLGDVGAADHTALSGGFEATTFLGAAAVALVAVGTVVGVADVRRRWVTAGLAVTALVAMILSLGPRTVLFRGAHGLVPGFDLARVPARWVLPASICAALLAAFALDAASAALRPRVRTWALASAGSMAAALAALGLRHRAHLPSGAAIVGWVVVGALCVAAWAASTAPAAVRRKLGTAAGALVVVAGVLVPAALVTGELGLHSRHSFARHLTLDEAPEDVDDPILTFLDAHPEGRTIAATFDEFGDPNYLAAGLRPNANALFDIRSVDGYDGGVQVTERWVDTLRAVLGDFDLELTLRAQLQAPMDDDLWARLGVRYVVMDPRGTPADQLLPGWIGPVSTSPRFEVWENPAWRADALAYFGTRPVADAAEAGSLLVADASGAYALTESDAPALRCRASSGDCDPQTLPIDRPNPEHITISTNFDRPAMVVVSEQWNDGWRATIDGESADVVPVDGLALGVEVPPGEHALRLTYRPGGLTSMLVIAAIASLAAIACLVDPVRFRRRPATLEQ